jgi:hypothetical protein
MKAAELIESVSDQYANNVIVVCYKELAKILHQFEDMVNAHGYNTAYKLAQRALVASKRFDWLLTYAITNNPKLEKSYNKLSQIREELARKINSGL